MNDRTSLIKSAIRDIPDYPKPGIVFKDITTLLKNPKAFAAAQSALAEHYQPRRPDLIAAIEARGFIFGGALAHELGCGFIALRKSGKLPATVMSETYALEYGEDTINMHIDSIEPGQRVVLIDDLLATGGTMRAAAKLVERAGGVVAGIGVVIELAFLPGREALDGYDVFAVVAYETG
ncbi:MAG TPA: adenine phosphoribosyltransferase [candidate division Zixibacteria bacterium]|jgi:adenine phosphoribosyltransferase